MTVRSVSHNHLITLDKTSYKEEFLQSMYNCVMMECKEQVLAGTRNGKGAVEVKRKII